MISTFILITAFASILHGSDVARKGLVIATHVASSWLLCGLPYAIFAAAWWGVFRRGAHARAELDYMSKVPDPAPILKAYYVKPIGQLVTLVVKIIHSGFLGERRQQEFFVTLLVTAPICALAAYLVAAPVQTLVAYLITLIS